MKNTVFLLFSFCLAVANAQLSRQPVTSFTPLDYGASYYTYCVAEDQFGLIYLGTSYGIIQYDGGSWRFIPVKAGANVSAIYVINDTIFVGTHNDFGYLLANETGKYEYYSITEKFHADIIQFSAIWNILKHRNSIVFHSDEAVFIYDGDDITTIEPLTSYHMAYVHNEELFVRERHIGMSKFDGNDFQPIPHGDLFADTRVLSILPAKDNKTLIVTREEGLWLWNNESFEKINLELGLEEFLIESSIIGGILLKDANYALYTWNNGVIVLNKELELIVNYDVDSGLSSNEITGIMQDSYGDLWLSSMKGPNRIQYTSPFSIFSHKDGLYGTVQAVAKAGNEYLAGTFDNLYITDSSGYRLFKEADAVNSGVWAISETPAGLYIAASNGVWHYDTKNFTKISNIEAFALTFVKEKNWLIGAGSKGVQIIDAFSGQIIKMVNEVSASNAYGLAYNYDDSSGKCVVWIGSRVNGVWQLFIDNKLNAEYDFYSGMEDGLDDGWICPYNAGNNILFATSKGSYRFISPDEMLESMNDSTIYDSSGFRGYFDINPYPKNINNAAITAFFYSDSVSYAGLDYYLNEINNADSLPDDFHFKTLQLGRINVIKKAGNVILVGGDNGLSIVDIDKLKEKEQIPPKLVLRRIYIGSDSLVWEGDVALSKEAIIIPYSQNSLLIELASSYYDNGVTALYSYKQESQDEFGRWTSQNVISLANLREGKHEFVFAAKNIHNEISKQISIVVQILPPWYRSWWAYSAYVAGLIVLVIVIIYLNIRRLQAKTRKLERIVKERTREVVKQKEFIEIQKTRIEDSIRYAQRIQSALLPKDDYLKGIFDDYFVLYKPKDVVSGDFYYANKVDDWAIIVAADCTGHGVPGAFMSMLGISFLNHITDRKNYSNAAEIVQKLRVEVIKSLKQSLDGDSQVDGMDLSLAVINTKTLKCHWAGAYNPLWIVRSNSIKKHNDNTEIVEEIKGDRMPVAIYIRQDAFTNHELQLEKGDRLYLFSDGYVDQFGGLDKKKFNRATFKKLIAKTSMMSMHEQYEIIERTIIEWKNPNPELNYDQIDDIVVVGIKI